MTSSNVPTPEEIPDGDTVSRWLDYPSMYDVSSGIISEKLFFSFPQDQSESVVWRRYMLSDDDVHLRGHQRSTAKRAQGRSSTYRGFRSAIVGKIRSIRTVHGHGFSITHLPDEGQWHAGISYAVKIDTEVKILSKGQKAELKLALGMAFDHLTPYIGVD